MLSLVLIYTFGLVSLFSLASCRSLNSGSEVKHTFGETSRMPGLLENCAQPQDPANEAVNAYLAGIMQAIMNGNPATFQGPYDPSKFCISLNNDSALNAFGLAKNRSIVVNEGLLAAVGHDADLAGVLAHEISRNTPGCIKQ